MTLVIRPAAALLLVAATACSSDSGILDARGEAARDAAQLWWFMCAVATLVFAAVAIVLLRLLRRAGGTPLDPVRQRRWLGGSIAVSAAILTSVFVASERAMGAMHADGRPDLEIHVRGWQWWWEVTYVLRETGDSVTTANEVVIPVGRRVRVSVTSGDVIHSLWVPNLHGKIDLVPGTTRSITLSADRPGTSRGPCAEYCGTQHAHMTLLVSALPPAQFASWLARERLPAQPPDDSLAAAGAAVFGRAQCAYCHLVRGTNSLGKLGPDLTHFASRATIAAGTVENTPARLTAWIADPQGVKPGTRMPAVPLSAHDLRAVVAYLRSLR